VKKIIVGSTGGSGCGYLLRYFFHISTLEGETHWIASDNFHLVLHEEFGLSFKGLTGDEIMEKIFKLYGRPDGESRQKIFVHDVRDLAATPSSGSVLFDAMVILPCSMKTLASAANGISTNLIERAADVSLKERRKLLLVARESPYSLIHIQNMEKLTLAGATIMPASPGFYHRPQSINDLYDFMVDRIFSHLKIERRVIKPWGQ